MMENEKPKKVRKRKQRGPNRQNLTLGGIMKQKKALKRKSRRKMNKEMGKAGVPAKRKSNEEKVMMEPPISVLFVDNTKNGTLARMLQETEKRLGGMIS